MWKTVRGERESSVFFSISEFSGVSGVREETGKAVFSFVSSVFFFLVCVFQRGFNFLNFAVIIE